MDSHDRHQTCPAIAPNNDLGLSPEQRLDAIADILVKGLVRLLIAEDCASEGKDSRAAQVLGNPSEVVLLNGGRDALMVARDEASVAHGGRTQ